MDDTQMYSQMFTKSLFLILFLPVSGLWAQATLLNPLNTVYNGSILVAETAVQNGLYFITATDGVHGYELWRTDGTPAGTFMLKDINPSADPFTFEAPRKFKAVGSSLLYFTVNDSIHGNELWVTDGSTDGTRMVKDIQTAPGESIYLGAMAEMQGKLYFAAYVDTFGQELWVSDGTAEGTHLVKDIAPGSSSGIQSYEIAVFNNLLFFAARQSFSDTELWVSDGTAGGTYRLKDIRPGNASGISTDDHLISTPFGVFFTAGDGVHGQELWFTNGDSLQTYLVKDINPSAADPGVLLIPDFENYAVYNNVLLFMGRSGTNLGEALWSTDGTETGTVMLKTFANESQSNAGVFRVAPQGVFFRNFETATGLELYFTDGTEAGTRMVKDIVPGPDNGTAPYNMQVAGNKLYFTAGGYFIDDGIEMWSSDGAESGTALFLDLNPGMSSGFPDAVNLLGDQLIFIGSQGNLTQALFKTTVNTVPVTTIGQNPLPLQIRPQPGSGMVHIAPQNGGQLLDRIVLVHPTGAETVLLNAPAAQYEWNCSQLPNGLYALLVSSGKQVSVRKAVVQH